MNEKPIAEMTDAERIFILRDIAQDLTNAIDALCLDEVLKKIALDKLNESLQNATMAIIYADKQEIVDEGDGKN